MLLGLGVWAFVPLIVFGVTESPFALVGLYVLLPVGFIWWARVRDRERERRAREEQALQAAADEALHAERARAHAARVEVLERQFGVEATKGILEGRYWKGQSAAMLAESLGPPDETSEKVTKTNTTHVFKYGPNGRSFDLKVTLENWIVVGWERND